MDDLSARSQPELVLDLIMQALRVRDAHLNAIAAELLTWFGSQPVRRLVLAAVSPKNATAHRVRALEVIARIRPQYGPDLMDLAVLRHARNRAVREAAARLLCNYALCVGVAPDASEPSACPGNHTRGSDGFALDADRDSVRNACARVPRW
jgi:hypothetical protein